MQGVTVLVALFYFLAAVGIVIYLLVLATKFVRAQKQAAKALTEIARHMATPARPDGANG